MNKDKKLSKYYLDYDKEMHRINRHGDAIIYALCEEGHETPYHNYIFKKGDIVDIMDFEKMKEIAKNVFKPALDAKKFPMDGIYIYINSCLIQAVIESLSALFELGFDWIVHLLYFNPDTGYYEAEEPMFMIGE